MLSMNGCRLFIVVTMIQFTVACASWNKITHDGEPIVFDGVLALQPPAGWYASTKPDRLYLTKDGGQLQYIQFDRRMISDAFPAIGKVAWPDMPPVQLYQTFLEDLQAQSRDTLIKVTDASPTSLLNNNGFRLKLSSTTEEQVVFHKIVYGFIANNRLYTITYGGPRIHYFERYKMDFFNVMESLHWLTPDDAPHS